MPVSALCCEERRSIVGSGVPQLAGAPNASRVVIECGFALRFPRNRAWLKRMINDPTNNGLDRNDCVHRAMNELGISRKFAIALCKLFSIGQEEALARAMAQFERN